MVFNSISTPRELSLRTTNALFDLKISPIASYGIQLIWDKLTVTHLQAFDKLEAAYLKRVLSVHRSSSNRLIYLMTGASLMTADLRNTFELAQTAAFKENCDSWDTKMAEIGERFLRTPAMKCQRWKEASCTFRERITRGSIHGFHHLLYPKKGYHEIEIDCRCELCGGKCEPYHLFECSQKHRFDWSRTRANQTRPDPQTTSTQNEKL